jgi:hypothetical protein
MKRGLGMKTSTAMGFSVILILIPLVFNFYVYAYYMSYHLFDPDWLTHAKNHLARSMISGAGMAIVGIVLALIPFRKLEMWSWLTLLCIGIFYVGAFWLSLTIIELDSPSQIVKAYTSNGLAVILYAAGLGLSWKHMLPLSEHKTVIPKT